jgi:tetratricopeptide (TPR) repeat protein
LRELDEEEADRRLLVRVEDIRIFKTVMLTEALVLEAGGAPPEYEKALRDYGVAVGAPPGEVGARLRKRPGEVRARIVAALDEWLFRLKADEVKKIEWLKAVLAETDPDPWREQLRVAWRQRDRKRLEQLASDPGLIHQPAQTLLMLGQRLNDCQAHREAQVLLRRAQAHHSGDLWINYYLGCQLWQDKAQRGDAVPFLTAAAALRPDNVNMLSLLAMALADSGNVERALDVFGRAITLKPDGKGLHWNIGKVLFENGKWEKASHAWRRFLELEPEAKARAPIIRLLGIASAASREWRQAADCYARALGPAGTDDGHLWFEYAAALLLSGDDAGYREAYTDMARRSAKNPQQVRPYHAARACTLAARADKKSVAEAARLADWELKAKRNEGTYWSLTEQAALHHRAGDFAKAAELLEKSLQGDGKKPGRAVVAWLWLALTQQRRGKTEEARRWLEEARSWLAKQGEQLPAHSAERTGLDLHNWLEAHILLREAEALLRGTGKPGAAGREGRGG